MSPAVILSGRNNQRRPANVNQDFTCGMDDLYLYFNHKDSKAVKQTGLTERNHKDRESAHVQVGLCVYQPAISDNCKYLPC